MNNNSLASVGTSDTALRQPSRCFTLGRKEEYALTKSEQHPGEERLIDYLRTQSSFIYIMLEEFNGIAAMEMCWLKSVSFWACSSFKFSVTSCNSSKYKLRSFANILQCSLNCLSFPSKNRCQICDLLETACLWLPLRI